MFKKYDQVYAIVTKGEGSPPPSCYKPVVRLLVYGNSYNNRDGYRTHVGWLLRSEEHYTTWHKYNRDLFATREDAEKELFRRRLQGHDYR